MRFTQNNKMLLVYRSMPSHTVDEMVDIMLTPQFYIVKKERIPVRTRYRAKKIASSLFEGLTEPQSTYEYFVYEEGDMWVFIAYDPEEVAAFLEAKGIRNVNVSKIYFAEQVVPMLQKPVALGDREVLVALDGTAVVVSRTAVDAELAEGVYTLPRPKRSVHLESSASQILTRRQAVLFASALIFLGIIWFMEGWRFHKNNHLLMEQKEALYVNHPSLQSRYTRDSILAKYRKTDKAERKKRNAISRVAGLIFKGVTVETFELDAKGYQVVFSVSDRNVAKRLMNLLKQTDLSKTPQYVHPKIIVKGQL